MCIKPECSDQLKTNFKSNKKITGECKKCTKNLIIKKKKIDGKYFIACEGFPDCKETQSLNDDY